LTFDRDDSDFNRNQESQMYRSLTAVLLCIFAQASAAQCAASDSIVQDARQTAGVVKKKPVTPTAAAATGGELIKTAAAGTHDDTPPPVARPGPAGRTADDEEHRRGGPAMLFAALALMSAIALRRFGASK
jgi:hypothetical protein